MLVHVKEHHTDSGTEIRITGPAQNKILADLKGLYKEQLVIDEDDEYVNVRDVPAIQKLIDEMTPAKALRVYRDNRSMSLTLLAELSGIPKGNLSKMEHGLRPIGKVTAQRLAKALDCDYRSLL